MNYKKLRQEYYILLEQMNLNLMQQMQCRDSEETVMVPKPRRGVVYVINQVGTNNYKIGISTNYDDRLKLFTVKLPFDIKETAVYETEKYVEKERELHRIFSSKRLNGSEFFELNAEELQMIPTVIYADPKQSDDDTVNTDPAESDDDLIAQATEFVRIEGRASTSLLQRKLRVGYSRAARIMDYLESEGIVGKADGFKPREIMPITALTVE